MDARGIETNDPGWINRRFEKQDRRIEALSNERRAAATSVETGNIRLANGGSLVVDGGDVLMLDTDGSELFRIGVMDYADRGTAINRDDGTLALAVRKAFPGAAQGIEIRDRTGVRLLAEETLGTGLVRPILHIPMQPVLATPATLLHGPYGPQVPVGSGTFTTTHQAWYARQNQFAALTIQIAASDTTTSAEVRVINVADGVALGGFFQPPWLGTRATGSTGYIEVAPPPLMLPGDSEAQISIALQVRRTAGTGTLQVALPESHGA